MKLTGNFGFALSLALATAGVVASSSWSAPEPPTKSAAKAADKTADKAGDKKEPTEKRPEPVFENVVTVSPEDLVNKPHQFLGKNVKLVANFFAYSSLALDYQPAYRSSKTHLSFLILRQGSHVPLSELKLAMMMPKDKDPEAQTLQILKDGDQVEMIGKVYSSALDEPWVEVFKIKRLAAAPEDKKAMAHEEEAKPKGNLPEPEATKGTDKK